jgi:putative hydrolase of the HAD superfamily
MLPPGVRAVYFDAVGTLIDPDPPAPAVYAAAARARGSRLDVPEVAARFRAAFRREEEEDRRLGLRTGEEREVRRWRHIVGAVFDDVTDPEGCFQELFAHFARSDAWRCSAEVGPVLRELSRRGYQLGLASNYDTRLRSVAAGLAELESVRHLVISSEVGWRKPAGEFFAALRRDAGLPPDQIALVGDDRVNDYEGARAAGLRPVFFDPGNKSPELTPRIGSLHELLSEDWPDKGDDVRTGLEEIPRND